MNDPIDNIQKLEKTTARLGNISGELYRAQKEYADAEEEWLELYDKVAAELKEELVQANSTRDPAEHTITSVARVRNRSVYSRWRRAKRAKEALETISSNRRAELTGYQTLVKNENQEAQVQDHFNQRPQPSWSGA